MPRYTKLKGRMFEMGITQLELQPVIKRGQAYITMRINGHKPWNAQEIVKPGTFLQIPREQWPDYFM